MPEGDNEVKPIEGMAKSGAFNALLRGPTKQVLSSCDLNWSSFVLERHSAPPGERPETVSEQYILGLWGGRPAVGEHAMPGGRFVRYLKPPGSIIIVPPGVIPRAIAMNHVDLTLCGFESSFLQQVDDELDQRPAQKPQYRSGFHDVPARNLIGVLKDEAAQGGPLGRLYVDNLSYALAIRLLHLDSPNQRKSRLTSPLPHRILRRVLERMQDLTADLDLQTLAAETGYSRHHFLRMFQKATGHTPHRYLLQLRLQRAQDLIREGRMSLDDLAAACGFSSHAHLSHVFRRILGVTPSEYRRNQ
jgi:AraC family transcriptional regulator